MFAYKEIVGFLDKYDLNNLLSLKEMYPTHIEMFEPGEILGIDNHFLKAGLSLSRNGLKEIINQCNEKLPKQKKKLKVLKNVELINHIILIICSANLLVILNNDGVGLLKYVSAIFLLLSSIINAVIGNKSTSYLTRKDSLYDIVEECITYKIKAISLNERFDLIELSESLDSDVVEKTINETNELCEKLYLLLEKLE